MTIWKLKTTPGLLKCSDYFAFIKEIVIRAVQCPSKDRKIGIVIFLPSQLEWHFFVSKLRILKSTQFLSVNLDKNEPRGVEIRLHLSLHQPFHMDHREVGNWMTRPFARRSRSGSWGRRSWSRSPWPCHHYHIGFGYHSHPTFSHSEKEN